jgi:hypothetical protein
VILRGLQSQTADLDRSIQTLALLKVAVISPPRVAATPAATPAPSQAQKKGSAPAQPAAPAIPPAPDPRVLGLLQDLDQGLQRIGRHIVQMAERITGQKITVETKMPGGNSIDPSGQTSHPEASKQ